MSTPVQLFGILRNKLLGKIPTEVPVPPYLQNVGLEVLREIPYDEANFAQLKALGKSIDHRLKIKHEVLLQSNGTITNDYADAILKRLDDMGDIDLETKDNVVKTILFCVEFYRRTN